VMALVLEGLPRSQGEDGPVFAPVPLHAADVLACLCNPPVEGERSLSRLELHLDASRDHPTQVNRTRRVVQLVLMPFFYLFRLFAF
jgi:hypothetical protein